MQTLESINNLSRDQLEKLAFELLHHDHIQTHIANDLEDIIEETIKYLTSYESIHTFQFGDEKKEDIEMNSQFDEKTFNELQRRYIIIHDKLLNILSIYKGSDE